MGDKDLDKTKIKRPSSKIPRSDDVTRLAPAKKATSATPYQEDKTRIVTPTRSAEDKTQISFSASATAKSDVTRFKPAVRPPEDKTRVATASLNTNTAEQIESIATGQVLSSEVETTEHGILKDRFVLESVLGSGGMGIVYKAKDLLKVEAQDRDPYVAIKVLSEEFKTHPEAFISLQRESRKSQRIAHPNIVNVYDFDRDGETVFMTMEFMDGEPLDELIRKYKLTGLPTDDAWDIIKGMSSALSNAHAENIIHSDFKPGNVFVTQRGLAKVFDFGIARAVSRVEHLDDNPEDKTIFDAANLGALTPAYASLEMLEGAEPDIRDDIYALGCVAYELFTGAHPYNKVPADEAERQKLKPKRITNINKRQWRAIEKAIAFRRENRVESVDKFIELMSPRLKTPNRMATVFALLLSVVITGYFLVFQQEPADAFSEFDIRNELELKIKIDFYKEDLLSLLENPTFTDPWENSVWRDVRDLLVLTKENDPWVFDKKKIIYDLYIKEINNAIKIDMYSRATHLIGNARRYTDSQKALDLKITEIASAIQLSEIRKTKQDKQEKQNRANRIAQQKKRNVQQQQQVAKQKEVELFDLALSNVNKQLTCQGRLNMRNFETAITKLKDLSLQRYNRLESALINDLAKCITQTGKNFPDRAREAKKHSLRIFQSNAVLAAINIQSRDPCDESLAGLGARGKRAICKDTLEDSGSGPELVVIPGNNTINTFAIGKYEISIEEFNQFCINSPGCQTIVTSNNQLPVSNLNIKQVRSYLKWLTKQSAHTYRLPTKSEWQYAAKSRKKELDANRNCQLRTRGIMKGGMPVNVSIGKQNGWGLVNYVGNVQEWAYDTGRNLVAVGGSYQHNMDNCDITTSSFHAGTADSSTGFRVLRELLK